MSGTTPGALPLSLERLVDARCQRFEKAWQTAGAARPELEAHLAGVPERARTALLVELLKIDAHYRARRGETPRLEEYRERLPELVPDLLADPLGSLRAAETPRKERDTADLSDSETEASSLALPGYEILEELGRGGMGVVYKARQTALNREVAIKMILAGPLAGPRARARHRQEAQAAAQLQHPHIVQIYEVGEHAGRPFFALEFVPGGNLDEFLWGQLPPAPTAAQVVETLAQAVHYAHERGVVHRDLKPANILLAGVRGSETTSPDLRAPASDSCPVTPKITDFGLAKILGVDSDGLTGSGDVLGTPSYMAPEQAAGVAGAAGPAVDIYGLGALLYELLTGRPPFRGETPVATVLQVKYQEPVAPSQLRPDCPRDLETICLKCLHKDPARRYATAALLADDLSRFRKGRPILARPVSRREKLAKWTRRHPAVAGLTTGLALVTALGLAAVLWQWGRAERRRDEAVQARNNEAEARQDALARLYASQVALAYSEFGASRLRRAEQILDACRQHAPDQCHWEWDYLRRQCRTQLLTCEGHTQHVNWLAYTPDGRRLASCGGRWNGDEPGEVKVWDTSTGKLVYDLSGPRKSVYRVAIHPEGDWLAAASLDGNVWRWDLRDGKALPRLEHGSPITSLAFHPGGKALAVVDTAGRVRVWDLAGGTSRSYAAHAGNAYDVAYSPDGKYLASAGRDAAVVLRDANTGEPLHWLYHPTDARRVAFSPDGRLLASGSFDGAVRVWDLAGPPAALATQQVGASNFFNLTFSPDGQRLACCTRQGELRVWSVRGQKDVLVPQAAGGSAICAAFSPDARLLATAKDDHVIRVWDWGSAVHPRTVAEHSGWVVALALSPDGRTAALAGGHNWSFPPGKPTVRLVDSTTGQPKGELAGHSGWLTSVAFHPAGTQLASGGRDKVAILWDPATKRALRKLEGHTDAVLGVAYYLQGKMVATASADGSVRLWDAESGQPRGTWNHPQAVLGLAASGDGRLLATAGADRVVRVWDAVEGRELYALRGHNARVSAVAFQPGSHWLASADEEQQLRFWDADRGEDLTRLRPAAATGLAALDNGDAVRPAPEDRDSRLAFSPDGRRLVLLGHGQALQLWDVPGRHLLLTLPEPGPPRFNLCAAFSADGRRLFTGDRWRLVVRDAAVSETPADSEAARRRDLAWHKDQASAAQRDRLWYGVEFHVSRLLEADLRQARWYAQRGTARGALGRAAEADADHAQAVALAANDPQVWVARGDAFVYQQRWREAEESFARAVACKGGISASYYRAIARLGEGDLASYRQLCQELLAPESPGKARSASEARLLAYTVAPLARGLAGDAVMRLGEQAATPGGYERVLCAACYRAGRFRDSLDNYNLSLRQGQRPRAWDLLFRAMAHYRLNEPDAARRALARARDWIAEADRVEIMPTEAGEVRWYHWMERVEVHAILREADALIGS